MFAFGSMIIGAFILIGLFISIFVDENASGEQNCGNIIFGIILFAVIMGLCTMCTG